MNRIIIAALAANHPRGAEAEHHVFDSRDARGRRAGGARNFNSQPLPSLAADVVRRAIWRAYE